MYAGIFSVTIYMYGMYHDTPIRLRNGLYYDLPVTTSTGRRKLKHSCIIVPVLSVLFAITLVNLAVQWQMTARAFVDKNDTRLSIFFSLQEESFGVTMAVNILTNLAYIIADGLLVGTQYFICLSSPLD